MEEATLLDGLSGPEDEMAQDLFSADSQFVSENLPLNSLAAGRAEEDEFQVFQDVYLSPSDPKEPLLHAFNPRLNADCSSKANAELPVEESEEEDVLGTCPSLPELSPLENATLPSAPPPPAYNVHFLSSLLTPHRSPAVVSLGAWAREGAAHTGVRVIPVELKEGGGTVGSNNPKEANQQGHPTQEASCMFPSSQEAEDTSGCSRKKDSSPMVLCQLKGRAQMLCVDSSGSRELRALHPAPQHHDQNNPLQSDVPKPMTAFVGRFLPVPAKLNLITQLDGGASAPAVNGTAFPSGSARPGPPRTTLAGYCDCFANGDFCSNCNSNNCCNNLRHEIERFKAIKACLDRNPEAFQTKIAKGKLGDLKPGHNKGCNCKRSGCLKNYCECFEAQIMCSSICKCIGCKNYEESPERKTLMMLPHCEAMGGAEGRRPLGLLGCRRARRPLSCISWEVVEAACACLLAQGEQAERERWPQRLAQQRVLEEFGRCLSQILHIEFKSRGLTIE